MIEMLKNRKEALQERGVKGFTLMEMLIVIAIIAVLVAIAIPVLGAQLDRSKEAADEANARSAYALLQADALSPVKSGAMPYGTYDTSSRVLTVTLSDGSTQTFQFSDRTEGIDVPAKDEIEGPEDVKLVLDSKGEDKTFGTYTASTTPSGD